MKVRRIIVSLMVALLLTVSVVATIGAANPTITITVTARVVSISNTPSSWDFELVDSDSTYETGLTCFNTTNDGNCEVDISISGSNMTGSGFTWELSDTATPDDMVYGLKAGLGTLTLYEYYNTGDDDYLSIYGQYWKAQTFSPSIAHSIAKVKLLLYRVLSPGTVTVSIRLTDGNGHPTGADLCSGTTDGDTLTLDPAGEWREITLGVGYSLNASTKYAMVIRAPNAGGSNKVCYRLDTFPTYLGGQYEFSTDSGSSWGGADVFDFMFEEYGGNYNVVVKGTAPYNYLVENLTVDSSQQWGLKIWTPTDYDDGNDKTGTVTITAAYSG